jgi:S-adenosylmethionine:tRNA-ribosyltransferase-isomerase (queuine synthetase)
MSLHEFDGPHFDADLIGPDGRLSRFCKGGQHRANAMAHQAARDNKKVYRQQKKFARKQASEQRVVQAQENEFRQRELDQNEEMINRSGQSPATQYIKDGINKKRSGYGISSTRGANAFGLGGTGSGSLG